MINSAALGFTLWTLLVLSLISPLEGAPSRVLTG